MNKLDITGNSSDAINARAAIRRSLERLESEYGVGLEEVRKYVGDSE